MDNILKKHVLSNYAAIDIINFPIESTSIEKNRINFNLNEVDMSGPTYITRSIESSDPDDFVLGAPTYLTHSIEESDLDEFRLLSSTTHETSMIKTADTEEIFMEPTKHTFSVEISDEDEFLFI